MTVYVSELPFIDQGREVFNLWADTSDEAVAAVYGIGGDLSQRRAELNAWEAYAITVDQFADALALGITITDKFGPAEWCAKRDGRKLLLDMISRARTVGCV